MSPRSLADKQTFFEQLDGLNYEDTEEDYRNNERETAYREETRSFFGKDARASSQRSQLATTGVTGDASQVVVDTPLRGSLLHRQTDSSPNTSASAATRRSRTIEATPLLRKATTSAQASARSGPVISFIAETPVPDTALPGRHPTLQRSTALPPEPLARSITVEQSPSVSSTMRKRKRNSSSLNMVPEADRIFQGLVFYYIPDNDIAPSRKMRITRAREHGVQWSRSLETATHVVVDKNLAYKDIESVLAEAAGTSPIIVNEDYPAESIQFRNLLNPFQRRYRVAGCPLAEKPTPSTLCDVQQSAQSSDQSLRVKERPPKLQRLESTASGGSASRGEGSPNENRGIGPNNLATASGVIEEPENTIAQSTDLAEQPQGGIPKHQPQRQDSGDDELSEYISLIQQCKDLPLDDEDDDLQSVKGSNHSPVSDSESESSTQPFRNRKAAHGAKKPGPKTITFEDRFSCNQGGTKDASSTSTNPNGRTIEILQSMCDYYTRTNDQWRTNAYRKAIATLKRQPTRITTEKEAYLLPNVGSRLAAKIEEIVTTDRLQRLDFANVDPMSGVLELFLKIYDVGITRASKWIAQGYRTLDDLLSRADLTANQRIGIERFDDLNTRIPRAEVEALAAYVRGAAWGVDPSVELLVGGSYRRGADSSGDIDFIVTKKGTSSATDLVAFLDELVERLTGSKFLVCALAAHRPGKGGDVLGGSKWHGCCVLPVDEGVAVLGKDFKPRWRRIDFLLVPETEYGAALIYFTGNDIFNRSMRLLASKKGMRLNQRGLYREVMRGANRAKVTEGELVEGRDEKKIFDILGVKWREPRDRWC